MAGLSKSSRPYLKSKLKVKGTWAVAPVVEQLEALSSISSTTQKNFVRTPINCIV
jgi:hypothetical protein